MFKKYIYNRFKWSGLPDEYTSQLIEQSIFKRDIDFVAAKYNSKLILTNKVSGFIRDEIFGIPKQATVNLYSGQFQTTNFVLLYDRIKTPQDVKIYAHYMKLFEAIDKALYQRIISSELIAVIESRNFEEHKLMRDAFAKFDGVVVNKFTAANTRLELEKQPIEFKPFNISVTETEALLRVKQEIEREFFTRFGISNGINKTHVTNANNAAMSTAEKHVLDFDFELRKQFCEAVNTKFNTTIGVEINEINEDIPTDQDGSSTDEQRDAVNVPHDDN